VSEAELKWLGGPDDPDRRSGEVHDFVSIDDAPLARAFVMSPDKRRRRVGKLDAKDDEAEKREDPTEAHCQ
jgi:hypothetical protein